MGPALAVFVLLFAHMRRVPSCSNLTWPCADRESGVTSMIVAAIKLHYAIVSVYYSSKAPASRRSLYGIMVTLTATQTSFTETQNSPGNLISPVSNRETHGHGLISGGLIGQIMHAIRYIKIVNIIICGRSRGRGLWSSYRAAE